MAIAKDWAKSLNGNHSLLGIEMIRFSTKMWKTQDGELPFFVISR
jgi:hypothetical protein